MVASKIMVEVVSTYAQIQDARNALQLADAEIQKLRAALREVYTINDESQGTFNKRGGTRRGLSMVTASEALGNHLVASDDLHGDCVIGVLNRDAP